jgi:hypothetical protein
MGTDRDSFEDAEKDAREIVSSEGNRIGVLIANEKYYVDWVISGTTLTITGSRYLEGTYTKQNGDGNGNGTSGGLTNTTWDSSFTDTDGTVITAELSFSGANAYSLTLNIDIGYGMTFPVLQSGTYTLAGSTITLKATSPNGISTNPGTLNGNTISMHIGFSMDGEGGSGDFTFTKK